MTAGQAQTMSVLDFLLMNKQSVLVVGDKRSIRKHKDTMVLSDVADTVELVAPGCDDKIAAVGVEKARNYDAAFVHLTYGHGKEGGEEQNEQKVRPLGNEVEVRIQWHFLL
jgi:hypothetical protein